MSFERQSLDAKRGEIRLRRKLFQQQFKNENCVPESFSSSEILSVLAANVDETREAVARLRDQGVCVSPFLELGAERGERSYVLCESGASGYALDLSLDALRFGNRLAVEFGFTNSPVRICGDVYNLPFRSNVFPFVFCFATLHHFPDPQPVVREAIRVVKNGGYFYFDAEPTQGRLAIPLWTRYGHKLSFPETLLDRAGILGFISRGGGLEREHGIIENAFALQSWIDVTQLFAEADIRVNKTLQIEFDPSRGWIKQRIAALLGGVTRGLCKIRKEATPVTINHWTDMLQCPTCGAKGKNSSLELSAACHALLCTGCGAVYPQRDGVFVLLETGLREMLYPDL